MKDIAEKYLIPGEVQTPAIMFVPSDSIYAELHANFPETLRRARQMQVVIVSPHVFMLVIGTIQGLMRDAKMREQAHAIQAAVGALLKFGASDERNSLVPEQEVVAAAGLEVVLVADGAPRRYEIHGLLLDADSVPLVGREFGGFSSGMRPYAWVRAGSQATPPGVDGRFVLHVDEPSVVVNAILNGKGNYGYNAANGTYGDMIEMGILDPTKVTRTALQNAASVAGLMLTTEAMVAEAPKEEPAGGGMPGGGMGGMGGMGMDM